MATVKTKSAKRKIKPVVKYSPTESALLKMLPKRGSTITIKEMAEKYYQQKKREMPFHGRVFIANAMRALERKMKANREKPMLAKTQSGGQREVEFWRE